MDDTIVKQGRKHPGLSKRMDFVEGDPAAMLLVEASGDTPEEASAGGAAIVGTGRSDFPNQVNNVLSFPGLFRGALEARATRFTESMNSLWPTQLLLE